jgi:hypothetical protein
VLRALEDWFESWPTWLQAAGRFLFNACLLGAFMMICIDFGTAAKSLGREWNWAWWQYALSIPALGTLGLLVGLMGLQFENQSRGIRALGMVLTVALVAAVGAVFWWFFAS